MGKGKVPNEAHLIIVPPTLQNQWLQELKAFFMPGSVDIFSLTASVANNAWFFTNAKSAWAVSKHDPIMRIILMTQSVSPLTFH